MGSKIPITLYTDIDCENLSASNPNVELALDVCAISPGLGSVGIGQVPCSSGTVQVYGFTDAACMQSDPTFDLIGNCVGRASDGAYAAFMLSCNQEEAGTPTATTSLDVGPIATSGSKPSGSASSSPGAASSGTGRGSSSSAADEGNALSTSAKTGIIIGSCLVVIILLSWWIQWYRRRHPEVVPSFDEKPFFGIPTGQPIGRDRTYSGNHQFTQSPRLPPQAFYPHQNGGAAQDAGRDPPPQYSYRDLSARDNSRMHNGNVTNTYNYNYGGSQRGQRDRDTIMSNR